MSAMTSVRLRHPESGNERTTGANTVQQYLDKGWLLVDRKQAVPVAEVEEEEVEEAPSGRGRYRDSEPDEAETEGSN